jgi:hypothetical protein
VPGGTHAPHQPTPEWIKKIIYISGDNGASAEGSPNGTPSEVPQFNGVELPVADQMKPYDPWGSQHAYSHFAVPWARAPGP